jgi:hypothetical protein
MINWQKKSVKLNKKPLTPEGECPTLPKKGIPTQTIINNETIEQ